MQPEGAKVTCTYNDPINPGGGLYLRFFVSLAPELSGAYTNTVTLATDGEKNVANNTYSVDVIVENP